MNIKMNEVTTLNVDDYIRERKKDFYNKGGGIGDLILEWDKNGSEVLKRFGVKHCSQYLGATHCLEVTRKDDDKD